jgi:hypothetical protein
LLAVLEPVYGVLQAGSLEILHEEPGMAGIVVRNQNVGIRGHFWQYQHNPNPLQRNF